MLLDSQSQNHFNDLQQSREARKRSPRRKSIHSLLKSYDKFSDYIDKNPGFPKKVTFLSSPKRDSVGKLSSNKGVTVSMEADRDMYDSPPPGNENNAPYFNEEPSLIIAIVRMVNGTAARCLKVKLMVNMQQFQELRTDPKRLKVFKKKLQPLMLDLLPAEDRFKPWTIDSIEPCDSHIPKTVTNCGTTNEKPPNRFKPCFRNENYFEPLNSEGAMDFSAASSPCQSNTFCNSEKTFAEERNISEDGNINWQQAEDLNRQHNSDGRPIDSSFKAIKDENNTTANSDYIESRISEKMSVCNDPDLFAILYNDDGQSVIENETLHVKEEYFETEQILHPSELPNHFSDTEVGGMEFATESSHTTAQNDGSKFDLSELLDKWDEESRFVNRTKSSDKSNGTLEPNSTVSTTGAVIAAPDSVKNCHSPIFKCPSSNLQSNSCLTPKKNHHLEPSAIDNLQWNCNETFNDDFQRKHQLSYTETICNRSNNDVTSPNNKKCLNKFNNYRSQSLVKNSSLLSVNSDENIIKLFEKNEQLNSGVAENCVTVNQPNDFWNTRFGCSALSGSNVQKIISPSKFKNFNTFPSESFRRLDSPILSSQHHTYSNNEQLGSLTNYPSEPVVHSPKVQSSSVSNVSADCRTNVIPNAFPKLEPLFQSCNSPIESTVRNSSLTFEHMHHQSYESLGETSLQTKAANQGNIIKNELNECNSSFLRENNEPNNEPNNVSIGKADIKVELGSLHTSEEEKNQVSQGSNFHVLLNAKLNPKATTTPLSFNRKPNCSILISSRLKSLSKNKSAALIATGRPIPKRKDIPFLMKGKLKKIKMS